MSRSARSSKPARRASSRPSSPASAIPAWTAAPPATSRADDPRFAGHAAAAQVASLLGRHGRRAAQRPLGAPPQVRRLRLHRLPRRPGPRPRNQVQPRRGRVLARAPHRLRDPGHLAQGFRSQAQGQRVHGGQLRPVPHRREFRRHAQRQSRPQALLRHELLWLPQDRWHERRHPRTRPHRGRQEVQDRLPVGIHRRAARQPGTPVSCPSSTCPRPT